jgi:hypothetical protein
MLASPSSACQKHLSESSIYQALDICLYLSGGDALVLVAIPIGFHKSPGLLKLVMVSLFCGLLRALITFERSRGSVEEMRSNYKGWDHIGRARVDSNYFTVESR